MNTTSFLPGNAPVLSSVLAHSPYRREDMEMIARGENPAQFQKTQNAITIWGLLYLGESEMGFFLHPVQTQITALFGRAMDDDKLKEIHLHIPYADITHTEFLKPSIPKNRLLRILKWFVPREEDQFIMKWKDTYSLDFFITTDSAEFIQKLKEKNQK